MDILSVIFGESRVKKNQALRSNVDIHPDDIVILNVGAQTWNKGIDFLLASHNILTKRFKNVKLILKDSNNLYSIRSDFTDSKAINDGSLSIKALPKLRIVSAALGIEQLRQLYQISDIYCAPYRGEGFNVPVAEALACGNLIAVTKAGAKDDFAPPSMTTMFASKPSQMHPDGSIKYYLEPIFDDIVAKLTELTKSMVHEKTNTLKRDHKGFLERYEYKSILDNLLCRLIINS